MSNLIRSIREGRGIVSEADVPNVTYCDKAAAAKRDILQRIRQQFNRGQGQGKVKEKDKDRKDKMKKGKTAAKVVNDEDEEEIEGEDEEEIEEDAVAATKRLKK